MAYSDLQEDSSPIYGDQELARELQLAMKSEPEIDLFKVINKSIRVKDELANNETIKAIVRGMWENVADFFEAIVDAPTLAGLSHDDKVVVAHKDMQANFKAVGQINQVFKDADSAEQQLTATDTMNREQEDAQL